MSETNFYYGVNTGTVIYMSEVEDLIKTLVFTIQDSSMPRNVRKVAEGVKNILEDGSKPEDLRRAKAIGLLDEVANDPNIPLHARSTIWTFVGRIESLA